MACRGPRRRSSSFAPAGACDRRPPTAERLPVFDRYARDVYVDYAGSPADRVAVIGSVRLDRLLGQARRLDRDEVRAALGLAPGERLVVLASQPFALEQCLDLLR